MTCPEGVVIETICGLKLVVVLLELEAVAGAISSPRMIFPSLAGVKSVGLTSKELVAT